MSMATRLIFKVTFVGIATGVLGFVLLGLTVHAEGIGFVIANILMPGVYAVGFFVSEEVSKQAFWLLVLLVQLVYAFILVCGIQAILNRRKI